MANQEIVTIEGITYQAEDFETKAADGVSPIYCLTLIGKRGKPVSQYRYAARRSDGSWHLGSWVR